jgi:hypothetical protein
MGPVLTLVRGRQGRSLAAALAAAACLAGLPQAAFATGRSVDVRLIDRDSGQPLPVYRHHGQGYTPGRPGSRYAIALRNLTGERLLVVLSVDGVNAVTGETAHWNQSGYVLDPYQSYEITGWRKSRSEVAAFEFTELRDSYAARTGRPFDVGVVGAAAFRERRPPWRPEPELSQSAPRPLAEGRGAEKSAGAADLSRESAAATAPAPGERLGTGHGERETSWVRHTRFERAASTPDEVVALRYDSFENLVAAGLVPRRHPEPHGHPRPFPEAPSAGYVPDPPRRWSHGW